MSSTVATGARAYHRVTVQNPARPGPSVEGDAIARGWTNAAPAYWHVALEPAAGDQERVKAGTVLTQPTVLVTGPFRRDITTATRLIDQDGRVLHVLGVERPGRRPIDLVVSCSEIAGEGVGWRQHTEWIQPGWAQA
jgi:head-tail adaptor